MIIVSFLLLLQPTGMNAVFFYAVVVWPFLKFLFLLGQFLFEFFKCHNKGALHHLDAESEHFNFFTRLCLVWHCH